MIEIANRPELNRFEITVDGTLAAITEYESKPGIRAFVSTETDDPFQGQGLAGRLVAAALDETRAEGLAVEPRCPYVRGFISKNPAYLDLVPEDRRAEFGLA